MSFNCQIENREPQPVLAVRTRTGVGNLQQEMGRAFGMIAGYLGEIGEYPAGAPYAAYYNMDMQDLDLEIGFPVARELPGKGAINPGQIPGGKVATCMHTGPYGEVGPAFEALMEYVKAEGCEATGVAYEMYLNDPQEVPEAELQTLVMFLLK